MKKMMTKTDLDWANKTVAFNPWPIIDTALVSATGNLLIQLDDGTVVNAGSCPQ